MGDRMGRHPRIRHWILGVLAALAVIAALPVVLVGAVLGALQFPWGRDLALGLALPRINLGIRGELFVDSLEGHPPWSLALAGVRLQDPLGREVAAVDRVELDLSLLPLLDRTVRIDRLRIEGVDAVLSEDPDQPRLSAALAPVEEARPPAGKVREGTGEVAEALPDWTVEAPDVTAGGVNLAWIRGGRRTGVEGVELAAAFGLRDREASWTGVRIAGRAVGAAVSVPPFVLTAEGRSDLDTADATMLLAAGPHRIGVRALLAALRSDRPSGRATLDARADLDALGALGLPVRGVLTMNGSFAGHAGDADGVIRLDTPAGPIRVAIRGGIRPDGAPAYDLAARAQDLRPSRLAATTVPVDARVSLDLRAEGLGNPLEAGFATMSLEATGLAVDGRPIPVALRVGARVRDGWSIATVRAEGRAAGTLGIRAEAFQPPPGAVRVDLDAGRLDLGRLAAAAGFDGVAGRLEGAGTLRGDVTPQGPGPARGNLDVRVAGLRVPRSLVEGGAALDRATLSAALSWPGSGLPTGTLGVDAQGAQGSGASVARANVVARLERQGGAVRARGTIHLDRAAYRDQGDVRRVDAPFDLALVPGGLPTGGADLRVVDARGSGFGVGEVAVSLLLRDAGNGALRVTGPVAVRSVRQGTRVVSPGARGTLHALVDREGPREARLAVDIESVRLPTGPSLESASLRVAADRLPASPDGTMRVRADAATTNVAFRKDLAIGRVALNATVLVRPGSTPTADVSLGLHDLKLPSRTVSAIQAHVSLDAMQRAVLKVTGDDRDFLARIDATVALPRGRRPLSADVRDLRVVEGEAGFRVESGGIRVDGGRVEIAGLTLGGLQRGTDELSLWGRADAGAGTADLHFAARDVRVADWVDRARRLTGRPLLEGLDPAGTLRADGAVTGTLARPEVAMTADLVGGRFQDIDGVAFHGRVRLDPEGLVVASRAWLGEQGIAFRLDAPVQASLQPLKAHLPSDAPFSLQARLTKVDLATFREQVGPPANGRHELAGRLDGEVMVEGTLRAPRGTIRVDLAGGAYGRLQDGVVELRGQLGPEATVGHLALAWNGKEHVAGTWEVPVNLAEVVQRGPEALRASLGDRPFTVGLKVTDFNLGDIPTLPSLVGTVMRPTVDLQLTMNGPLRDARVAGDLSLRNFVIGLAVADVAASMDTDGGDLGFQAAVITDGEDVARIDGRVPGLGVLLMGRDPASLMRNDGTRVHAGVGPIPMTQVAAFLPGIGRHLSAIQPDGVVEGVADLVGGAAGASLEVRAQSRSGGQAAVLEGLARALQAHLVVGPDLATLAVSLDQGEGHPTRTGAAAGGPGPTVPGRLALEAEAGVGTVRLLSGASLDPAAVEVSGALRSGAFQLAGLSRLLPAVFGPTKGTLDGECRLTGTAAAPRLDGALQAEFQEVTLAAAGLRREDLPLRVEFRGERIHLVPLDLQGGGGRMMLALDVTLRSLQASAIGLAGRLRMERFQAMAREDLKARLSGALDFGGTLAVPAVSGRIRLDDTFVAVHSSGRKVARIGHPPDVTFVDARGEPVEVEDPGKSGQTSTLSGPVVDVRVEIPPRAVRVEHSYAEVVLAGDVRALSEGPGVALSGRIEVLEGKLSLYGRNFDIDPESHVVFRGTTELDPNLDVTAHHSIAAVDLSSLGLEADSESRITVHVTGTARKPKLEMTSEPPMDESSIVSIIALGQPMGAQGQKSSVQAQTANLVAGLATGTVSRLLQDQLPIDVFQFQTGPGADLSQARVTLGKRLTRDLTVSYHANLGATRQNENVNEVRVQYDVGRGLQIETRYGDAGQGALDLLWKKRFR